MRGLRTGEGWTTPTFDPHITESGNPVIDELSEQLRREQDTNLLLTESLADAELALEDRGWVELTARSAVVFSRAGLKSAAHVGRVMAVTNTLIRRGVALRIAYVWGDGVQVAARSGEGAKQDVNAVIQEFLDDEGNRAAFTGEQAHEENERALATDGNLGIAFFTKPRTGRVQVRTISFDEIEDVICNPDDKDEPWFYERRWTSRQVVTDLTGTSTRDVEQRAYYPALGYRPATKRGTINSVEVRWDTPVLLVSVNRLNDWSFGIGDVYTALPWARAYREFMADWAQLVKALSQFAWRVSSKGKTRATKAAQELRDRTQAAGNAAFGTESGAGASLSATDSYQLEAIPKTGATIDSESGRPLAALVAAGLDLPVTMLLGDPGVTGARATAETLDEPQRLSMEARRQRWAEVYRRVTGYVIAESVRAPAGALKGAIGRDEFGREVVTLTGDVDATVTVEFPPLDKIDPLARVQAITEAEGTGKMPPLTTVRLLLQALGVDDIDSLLDELTDDAGNWIDPQRSQALGDAQAAAQAALDAVKAGDVPADNPAAPAPVPPVA
ncbi:hypothetical protein ACPPVT_07550 [Angustibacter sp. McL0619]|uniref:hypothetical protein n=1 Tax=Angustibacter sp. McL0619 TaxID=3415676 RepID=UPI003CEE8A0F